MLCTGSLIAVRTHHKLQPIPFSTLVMYVYICTCTCSCCTCCLTTSLASHIAFQVLQFNCYYHMFLHVRNCWCATELLFQVYYSFHLVYKFFYVMRGLPGHADVRCLALPTLPVCVVGMYFKDLSSGTWPPQWSQLHCSGCLAVCGSRKMDCGDGTMYV